MKKMITIAALLLLSVTVFAKADVANIGMRIGTGLTGHYGKDAKDTKMTFSFCGGTFFNYGFNETLGIQSEVLFAMKGAKYDTGFLNATMRCNYISIPVLARIELPTGNLSNNLFVLAGPEVSFLMTADVKDIEVFGSSAPDQDIKDVTASTDFGLVFGLGMNFGNLEADFRYDIGMISLDKEDNGKVKNQTIGFNLGYGIPIN